MIKKMIMLLTAFMLVFGSLSFVSADHASAKGFKSGKKSFSPSPSQNRQVEPKKADPKTDTNMNASKTKQDTKTTTQAKAPQKNTKGSFMKGLLLGGLGGLLMGSLFHGLGGLGTVLAFLINMMVIVGVIMLIRRAFIYFKHQRSQKVDEAWKR